MQKKNEKWLKPWHMGTHLRILGESYLMNTNVKRFRWFKKSLHPCALDVSSLNIGRVKILFAFNTYISDTEIVNL